MAKKKLSTESVWLVLDRDSGEVLMAYRGRADARAFAKGYRDRGGKATVKSGEIQTFVYTASKG